MRKCAFVVDTNFVFTGSFKTYLYLFTLHCYFERILCTLMRITSPICFFDLNLDSQLQPAVETSLQMTCSKKKSIFIWFAWWGTIPGFQAARLVIHDKIDANVLIAS